MAIKVAEEDLGCAVGTPDRPAKLNPELRKMIQPRSNVLHTQREMVPSMMRLNRFGPFADDVEFLVFAESKPCAGKGEGWAGDAFESQDVCVEFARFFHVPHMNSDVV